MNYMDGMELVTRKLEHVFLGGMAKVHTKLVTT